MIEIIAVLVILGILAAVAVPRYMDMQGKAEEKSLQAALNDMKSRAVSCYSKSLLDNNGVYDNNDCSDFNALGLNSTDVIDDTYQDFAGTWGGGGDSDITYTGNNIDTCTFGIDSSDDANPPDITTTGEDCP